MYLICQQFSRMAMQLKNSLDNSRLHGFGMLIISGNPGDRRLLSQLVFCAIASLILTLITRRIIQRANINLAFVGIIYTALLLSTPCCSGWHFLIYLRRAHGKYAEKAPRSKFPALLVVALALVALVFVIWRVDGAPSTNDAYASARYH